MPDQIGTLHAPTLMQNVRATPDTCRLAVIWIDFYAYHLARLRGLLAHQSLARHFVGFELVGGTGVHAGLIFRDDDRSELPVKTLFPASNWNDVGPIRLAKKVWSELSILRPEAVLVPGYYTLPGIAAALWAKAHRRRSILMTESTREDHRRSAVKEFVKSVALRLLFDRAIVGGTPHARYLKQLGFPEACIVTGYDAVDNQFYQNGARNLRAHCSRSEWSLPESYFLFVGRLAEEKNVSRLLDAFAGYVAAGGSWDLVIAGEGPLKAPLVVRARESGCESRVHFAGMKSARQLLPYYAFARCFVLPSIREPWGLVVNEAMAAGLPVLVSQRCGCAEDLVREGNGFVFDPTNPAEIETCFHRIETTNPYDRDLMGHRSHEIIARYSPENWALQVERCLA